jgi:Domain of unknown function (DUF4282)
MFCRQCGNRLAVGSSFCAGCGAKANVSAAEPDPTRETSNIFNTQTKEFFESLRPAGFFESLFDFSFTSLVTTKLIKVLYGLSIAVLALGSLFFVLIAFSASSTAGAFMLIFGAPLFFLLGVCYTRVMLEIMIVLFRIAEHTAEIAQQVRTKEARAEIKSSSQ